MKLNNTVLSAFLCSALFLPPAYGQSQQRDQDQRQSQRQGQSEGSSDRARMQQKKRRGHISGTIIRTKLVDVKGTADRHQVVLLRTERGKRVPIDLGPTKGLRDVTIKSGQDVTAYGTIARIGEKSLVIAEQLRVGDQQVRLRQRRPMKKFQGEITNIKTIQLKNQKQPAVIARVETEQQTVFALLGNRKQFDGLELNEGDKITLRGRVLPVKDRTFVIADRFSANGETVFTSQQSQGIGLREARDQSSREGRSERRSSNR